jgi:ABC-type transporter Mla maintaining outer membrane lipid asymmetry ATPase subunit MlaF
MLPDLKKYNAISVFGKSGSGKSYLIAQICKEYRKLKSKIPIYLISRVNEDKAFDVGFDPKIIRVPIDDSVIEQPLTPEDFPNGSIIICDDYNMITDPKRCKAIKKFVNTLMETGRHSNITPICVQHKALSGRDTMALHSECTLAILFPNANFRESEKYLNEYLSFSTEQINMVKEIAKRSRWISVTTTHPTIICSEKFIKIL